VKAKWLVVVGCLISMTQTLTAQETVRLRNLWHKPEVHVLFNGYTISLTIRDINRAMSLMSAKDQSTYGSTSGLDTMGDYTIELYEGVHTEYHNRLQQIVQERVGALILLRGRAAITNKKGKKLSAIEANISPVTETAGTTFVSFYDPHSHILLFQGKIADAMIHSDLGID
jgi:hypothetical protein